ncbi:Crp/Fnr family transcriptional regulator [Chitinophaga sp. ARDCPP14]|uniref:Crp/Fnr family transcriptional regulator n=1 Tax=Chitinophaga sp. ARDCPP14 TaxID=3391139 RepID=UPI003F51D205
MNTDILYTHICSYVKISREEYEHFLQLFKPVHLKKGELHYVAGKVPKYWSFILKGCLREYLVDTWGNEQIFQFYEENTWVGQVESMITRKPTEMSLQALEDCELLCITGEDMCEAVKTPWIQHYTIQKSFADNAALISENFNRIKSTSPEVLYLEILKERPSLLLRVPQHYIANFLSMRKETLSRVRKRVSRL